MKIAVITDSHANLPALRAALAAIHCEGCDAVYHTGDAIGIGPFPAECLDLLLSTPNMRLIMGNHDSWLAGGLPQPQPAWMSDGEVQHQNWTHAQCSPQLRSAVAQQWPFALQEQFDGVQATFVHYAIDVSGRDFAAVIKQPTAASLDALFAHDHSGVVFYGHHHPRSDLRGRARYINPGSLGCHDLPLARYVIAEFRGAQCTVDHCCVPYDDAELFVAFERRQVPERAFIYRAFFGGRFASSNMMGYAEGDH